MKSCDKERIALTVQPEARDNCPIRGDVALAGAGCGSSSIGCGFSQSHFPPVYL